jgi:fatty-acyl-CoA synthase/O-succinylbenzoic acid--CoA ligase
MDYKNLIDLMQHSAKKNTEATAFIFEETNYTYLDLLKFILVAEKAILQGGIKKGDLIGVTLYQDPFNIIITLALAKIGAISIPMHPLKDYSSRKKIAEKFKIRTLISPDEEFKIEGIDYLKINNLSIVNFDLSIEDFEARSIDLNDPCRIALSTGTTGDPKGVLLTHGQIIHRIIHKLMPCEQTTKLVPFDLSYAMGLIFSMSTLEKGGCLIFLNKHQSNEGIWHAINFFGITDLILSPAQVFEKLKFLPPEKLSYPRLKSIQIVGDKCPQNIIQVLKNKVTPFIFSTYGISEIGGIAIADLDLLEQYPNITGKISSALQIKCISKEGEDVVEGNIGHILIKTDHMPKAYYLNLEKTRAHFVDGWFYTGDLGKILKNNLLFLEGRVDTLLNIGGQMIDPDFYETKIKGIPGIDDAFVFSYENKDQITELGLVFSGDKKLNLNELITKCREDFKISFSVIKYSADIPREANGKFARESLTKRIIGLIKNG